MTILFGHAVKFFPKNIHKHRKNKETHNLSHNLISDLAVIDWV